MGGPRMQDSQYDNVVLLRGRGLKTAEIANVMGVSDAQIKYINNIHSAAVAGDMETLKRQQKHHGSIVAWACKRHGISLDDTTEPEETEKSKPDNTALAFVQLAESLRALTSAVQAIDQRLSAMQMTQAGFRSDVAEQTKKIVEAIHVEGDIITQENNKMIDLLSGIKCNTRKRGGNDAV